MTNQQAQILKVLKADGGITRMVGFHYGVVNLPDIIMKLRKFGHKIITTSKRDSLNKTYTRWVMESGE